MNVVEIARLCCWLLLWMIASSSWRLIQAPGLVLGLSHERDVDRLVARSIQSGSIPSPVRGAQPRVWRVVKGVEHHWVMVVWGPVMWSGRALVSMSEIGIFCTP